MLLLFGFLGRVEEIHGERLSRDNWTLCATDSKDDAYHDYGEYRRVGTGREQTNVLSIGENKVSEFKF